MKRFHFWGVLLLGLAFSLRLYGLDFQSIWWDEGHSIFVAGHPLSRIPTLPAMDVHPPGYFGLLHLWMGLAGQSVFALRYLSVIFSLLTVALVGRFGAALTPTRFGPQVGLLAGLLAALSPLYVAYAQEVRSYAMITFLALLSTYLLGQILFLEQKGPPLWRTIAAYSLASAAALYTHYFTVFLLLFHNLAWLIWTVAPLRRGEAGGRARLLRWSGGQMAILLLFAPQLALALRQVTSYTNPNLIPPGLGLFINRSWQAYTVGLTIDPTPARWGMLGLTGVLGLALLLRRPDFSPRFLHRLLFLVGWLGLPLVAYFGVLQSQPSFEPRYMILVTPALFLLLAWLVGPLLRPGLRVQGRTVLPQSFLRSPKGRKKSSLSPWERVGVRAVEPTSSQRKARRRDLSVLEGLRRWGGLGLMTITTLILAGGLFSYYTNPTYFKDDSGGLAAWLAAETRPQDIVYIDVPHPLHYYADQAQIPAPTRYLFVDIHTAAATLNREAGGRERLFWVTWRGSDTDPRGVIPFLAEKAGDRQGQRDFRGYHVVWFELPATEPAPFSLPAELPPVEAVFGDLLRLDGAAFGRAGSRPGEPVWATLHFTLLRPTSVDYKLSLRLRDEAGQVVSQIDRLLLNDRHFRTSAWPAADPALNQATNVYLLPLPPETPPGRYRLEAVVYDAQPPYPSEGVSGPNSVEGVAARLGSVTLGP